MTTYRRLQFLPLFIEERPELFSTDDLQDLLQILASWENNPPENAKEILRDWYKARPQIRDGLRDLAQKKKQLEEVPPSQANQSPRLTDFFQELSEKVKEKLSEITNSTKSDSAKPDKNQNND